MSTAAGAPLVHDLETQDLDEARHLIDDVFTPHRLVFRGQPEVDLRLSYSSSERLTVGVLRYGADVKVEVPPPVDCFHLALPLKGACTISQGRDVVSIAAGSRGALMSTDQPLSVHWSPDSVQYIVKIPRVAVEQQLERLTGRPVRGNVHFDLEFDLRTPAIQALVASVDFLRHELDRVGGVGSVPLAREHLEWCILTQLLMAVPHDHTDLLAGRAEDAPPGRIPQLVEYIEQNLDQDLSSTQLAQRAGIAERTLQLAFRKSLGMTPAAYVRTVRLDRAHEDLLALPDQSISDIAVRWGFFHPSRFASQYRDRFGELPSQTRSTCSDSKVRISAVRRTARG